MKEIGRTLVPQPKPSTHFFRAAAATVCAHMEGITIEEAIRTRWPNDELTPIIARAASTQATLTDPAWAGPLAMLTVSDAIEELVAMSAIGKLIRVGAFKIDLGRYATVVVPGRALTAADAGAWLAEGAPIPVRQLQILGPQLTPHKLAVLVPMTREMTEASNIEEVVKQLLREASTLAIDAAIFSPNPASPAQSAGLLNGLTALTPSSSTLGFDACGQDLGTLTHNIALSGGGSNVAFIASPKQATAIKFWSGSIVASENLPVAGAASVPDGTVIAIEPASLAISLGAPEFSVSSVAAVHQEDTAPVTNLLTGSPVKSMFQTDAIVLKMELWGSWAMRAPHVSFMSAVNW